MHTYVCISGGKKCPFFRKFGVLCFLVTSVLRFGLLFSFRRNEDQVLLVQTRPVKIFGFSKCLITVTGFYRQFQSTFSRLPKHYDFQDIMQLLFVDLLNKRKGFSQFFSNNKPHMWYVARFGTICTI